jgi:hypothetical protein
LKLCGPRLGYLGGIWQAAATEKQMNNINPRAIIGHQSSKLSGFIAALSVSRMSFNLLVFDLGNYEQ